MPSIADVQLTDTFDTWRQKTNQAIDTMNTLSVAGTVLSITGPVNGQLLLFNGTNFSNVTISGDLTVDQHGVATVSGTAALSKGRLAFAGAIRSLF